MERPTDAYKLTNNVRIAKRDLLFGGQVSRLQVAELIASAIASPDVAENKVPLPITQSLSRDALKPCLDKSKGMPITAQKQAVLAGFTACGRKPLR